MELLTGLRVIDLTRLLPGAYATMQLADLGADVVKVEEPRAGDYMRDMFPIGYEVLNRNKRSIAVDLKTDAGRALLTRLAQSADVLVENFRPGVADRLGVGYDALAPHAPRLVYCAVSGYGQSGPYRLASGHDINYQSVTGMSHLHADPTGPPHHGTIAVGDLTAAMCAVTSILAALVARDRTGSGQYLDVAMTDVLVSLAARYIADYTARDDAGREAMGRRTGYGLYRTADDRHVSLGCVEDVFWHRFLDLLDPDDPLRAHRERDPSDDASGLDALVAKAISRHDRASWLERAAEADVPIAPAHRLDEVASDPHMAERELFRSATTPGVEQVRFPTRFSAGGPEEFRPPPALGQHTDEVLAEFGLDDDEIVRLRHRRAIR